MTPADRRPKHEHRRVTAIAAAAKLVEWLANRVPTCGGQSTGLLKLASDHRHLPATWQAFATNHAEVRYTKNSVGRCLKTLMRPFGEWSQETSAPWAGTSPWPPHGPELREIGLVRAGGPAVTSLQACLERRKIADPQIKCPRPVAE